MFRFAAAACPIVLTIVFALPVSAQQIPGHDLPKGDLTTTVGALDTKLFDAYNHCDLKTLNELVTDDLEFYHDKTGLAKGKKVFLESIQNNICGKVHRELTPGTLEVHRLENYGALEIGAHSFSQVGRPADTTGDAKFAMLWEYDGESWKLARVISYDHEPAKK